MEHRTIIRAFTFPAEAHVAKSYLESYGIETYLQDEMTVQVHNFYSNAIGGVKLLVKESDCEQGIQLLKDGGFINDAEDNAINKIAVVNTEGIKSKCNCPFCNSENISRSKTAGFLMIGVYFIFGAPFPVYKSTYKCFDCNKEWKFKRNNK